MDINEQLLDALKQMVDYVFGDLEAGKSDVCDDLRKLIAAAEQAQHRCQYCDGTGDVHSPTGEWLGACDCESFQQAQQAEPATHSPIALQSIPKRQRDFTAENIRDIAHECMRIGDNEQAAVVFAIADALRDGNLTIHPAAVAVRIRELEAQLNAAILARQEAQQIAQEAIEARNRAGVEIRRPLLKRIRELQAQHGELVSWMTHIQGAALDMSTPRQAIHLATVNAIAAAAQPQAEPVALIMCDGKSYDFMVTAEGQKRIPDTGEFVHLYATQPPAVADRDAIRRVFLAHGFTIKDGQIDLKPYVYEAAEALLRELSPTVAVPDITITNLAVEHFQMDYDRLPNSVFTFARAVLAAAQKGGA